MNLPCYISPRGKLVEKSDQALLKAALISKYLSNPLGRAQLAQSMANPIRRNLDYQGIARKTFLVQQMPPGALPTYDRDPDVAAVVQESGQRYRHDKFVITPRGKLEDRFSRIFGQRVVVPTFEIFSNPTVRITDVKRRRFNLIDRAVQTARQQIMEQEDANAFAAMDAIASAPPVPVKNDHFWCDGCGEPRYKCYCENVCPDCGKKEYRCIAESDTGICPGKPINNAE